MNKENVVEVVRCINCGYSHRHYDKKLERPYLYCNTPGRSCYCVTEHDFCSKGRKVEKRESPKDKNIPEWVYEYWEKMEELYA